MAMHECAGAQNKGKRLHVLQGERCRLWPMLMLNAVVMHTTTRHNSLVPITEYSERQSRF